MWEIPLVMAVRKLIHGSLAYYASYKYKISSLPKIEIGHLIITYRVESHWI